MHLFLTSVKYIITFPRTLMLEFLKLLNFKRTFIHNVDLQSILMQQQHRSANVQRRPNGHGNVRNQLLLNNIVRSVHHIYRICIRRKFGFCRTSVLYDSGGKYYKIQNFGNKRQVNTVNKVKRQSTSLMCNFISKLNFRCYRTIN